MSDQLDLDWDAVLGGIDEAEKDSKKDGKSDFDALPAGPYPVLVQETEDKPSSSGNDMIKVRCQVQGGPYDNRILFGYIVFAKGSPKSMKITLEKLAAFGLTREYIATTKPSIHELAELLVGRKANAIVGIQKEGNYKGSNEVKGFKPLAGADQPAPVVAEAKPAGVPNIPTPAPAPEAAAPSVPVIPTPDVPGAPSDADVFGDEG